ncbi:MAG: MOSC domain-containing protein YiiM [Rhodoferax sp.]|jgi:MOSC domain-containing protein YiiM
MPPMPKLLSLQTAPTRRVQINGRPILTAIYKQPSFGMVPVLPLGLDGDEQADLSVHGGLDKAVYAYPSEHYPFWRAQRTQAGVSGLVDDLPFGAVGENLTLEGVLERDVWVGDTLQFANCTLRVTLPREPCYKFNAAMGFSGAVKAMALNACCGFYLAVDWPGTIQAGESFKMVPGPRRLSIPESFNAKMFKHLR